MALNILFFILGLLALYLGAEGLVKGASKLARILGIRPVVIGLTVVAFGTSTPELVVSLLASLKGSNDIAMGNVVGSNIANIGLILGISALIRSLKVEMKLLKVEVPIMIGASLLLYAMAWGGEIEHLEGFILLAGILSFTIYSYYGARKEPAYIEVEYSQFIGIGNPMWKDLLLIIFGLLGLLGGAYLLVNSAIFIAKSVGISELIIGLTIVAIGTSLPELATSTVAAFRKEYD